MWDFLRNFLPGTGNFSLKPGIFSLERCYFLILGLATTKASCCHSLADTAILGEIIGFLMIGNNCLKTTFLRRAG